MKKGIRGRVILLTACVVISAVFFLPSTPLYPAMPGWWKRYLPSRVINLGLDLRGGIHLVLQVEEEKAVDNSVERAVSALPDLLKEKNISGVSVAKSASHEITLRYEGPDTKETLIKFMDDNSPTFALLKDAPPDLVYLLREGEAKRMRDSAISQALETIRNRIDQFGVAEPLIQRQGTNQIVIQLPGVEDPQRAIALIGKTALLEFKLVDDEHDLQTALQKGEVPEGDMILTERVVDKETGQVTKVPYLLKSRTLLTGDQISDARVTINEFNEPYVSLQFSSTGGRIFEAITAEAVKDFPVKPKKRIAIILDDNVYSAPVVQERITGGRAQITGRFTMQEANDLAIALRAGSLPAPVTIIQNLTVGPTLGRDSIDKGIRATIIAGIAVVIFMGVYYRLSGLVADFALVLNLIVLIGALASLNATLTLPGIAGIGLTIGMGVDSNVLIFERIREELRAGRPVRLAVDAGYEKAFLTIVDSHVTTLITAAVLFLFGTGPIKGFAVSLSLGVLINLFTALVGTKVVFDWVNSRWRLQRLSI